MSSMTWRAAEASGPRQREIPSAVSGVLECLDYAWYESLDVRLYGSLALLQLWPELDKNCLAQFRSCDSRL